MMSSQRKLRVVHLDTGMTLRGGQRQLLLLARGLKKRGYAQLIVCPEGSELEVRAGQDGFDFFTLPAHDPAHAFGILLLRQRLQTAPFEILHSHDGRAQTVAWLASLGMPVRRVASRRVTFLPSDNWSYRWKYGRTCHAVIAVSEYIRELIIRSGIPSAKIAVIPDGIVPPAELPPPQQRGRIRARWGFSDEEFVLGHLGAFTREKGQDVLLDAISALQAKLPAMRLALAGEGPTQKLAEMRKKIEDLRGHIHLCGVIEDPGEFFPALDVFVMPSRSEGLGSSALLAMAYGIPVIASRVGGLPEVVTEGEAGWLVAPESPGSLADAIFEASADRTRLSDFGAKARLHAERFSADKMLARTEALYERLLSGRLDPTDFAAAHKK